MQNSLINSSAEWSSAIVIILTTPCNMKLSWGESFFISFIFVSRHHPVDIFLNYNDYSSSLILPINFTFHFIFKNLQKQKKNKSSFFL